MVEPELVVVPYCMIAGKLPSEATQERCFVAMSFAPALREIYDHVIRPTVTKFGLQCVRGDEIVRSGVVIDQVQEEIRRAACVIADLTEMRPNVLYEVGLAHALGKNAILLVQRAAMHLVREQGFDVAHWRCITYDQSVAGAASLATAIHRALEDVVPMRKAGASP